MTEKYLSISVKIMFVSTLFIAIFSIFIFDNMLYTFISTVIFLVVEYNIIVRYIKEEEFREWKGEVFKSFKKVKTKFGTSNTLLEADAKKYGANIRVYVTDKDAENFEGMAQKIMDYLKEEEEMNLFYTIQCARVNNKKEIFKERIRMKLNILELRNEEREELRRKQKEKKEQD